MTRDDVQVEEGQGVEDERDDDDGGGATTNKKKKNKGKNKGKVKVSEESEETSAASQPQQPPPPQHQPQNTTRYPSSGKRDIRVEKRPNPMVLGAPVTTIGRRREAAAANSNRAVAEVPEDMRALKYGARGDGDDDDDDHRHYADDHENHENHEDRDRGGGGGRWKAMDSTDLRAYVGLLILAGVYRSRGEAASSLWDAESGRTIFRATMPLKVFHAYSRLLRFDDRQTRAERRAAGGGDKLAAVREVWDKWVERLPLLYNPGPDVTVDEQLVPFRGRCPFRQYIPSKPAKYGIKTWVACDSKSSYAWKMQVYTGKATCGGPEKNQGMRVVLDLTQGLRGHNVTCDNFFTSYELARQLLTRNVTVVGTVRKNKPELPQALLASKDRLLFSSKFAFTSTTALVSYLAKKNKNVLLLSTLHTEAHVSASPGQEAGHRPRLQQQQGRAQPHLDAWQAKQEEGVPRAAGKGTSDSVHTKKGPSPSAPKPLRRSSKLFRGLRIVISPGEITPRSTGPRSTTGPSTQPRTTQ
ncbi:uncharacterized protein LOC123485025 [Coregonus clupeaformis]|uniref:uncharacterized protein LOC123485025 n=1 Tax=Coregonus clupeaformis TaxID=59861 RepID=UPI001E1C44E9|nr:uncharacterized protein LOC123485025 [Coregonus clupeaformis]